MLLQSLQPRKLLQLFLRHCFGSLYFSWQYVLIVSDANIRHGNDIVLAPIGSKSMPILKIKNKKFVFFDYLIVFFRFYLVSKLHFRKTAPFIGFSVKNRRQKNIFNP